MFDNSCVFINREKLLNKYLNITENNHIPSISDDEENIDYCKKCHCEKILIQATGVMVCQTCGEQQNILVDSDKPSYKDPPREISYFAYKRINHFNEFVSINALSALSILLIMVLYYFIFY